ncbi:MAG: radical SAM protein [Clostridia bacterium]|nr:radical SAM protein [Clostridia bacterium]
MKKILMIQPPQFEPTTPYGAIPLLRAQLDKAGFETHIIDLNIKFYHEVLKPTSLKQALETAKKDLAELEKIHQHTDFDLLKETGTYEQKMSAYKYVAIKEFFEKHSHEIPAVFDEIDCAVKTMKDPELFYDPEALPHARHIITVALQLASLPYAPNELSLYNYYLHPDFILDWKWVKEMAEDDSTNMFYDYLHDYCQSIANDGYDIVCISMIDLSQLVATFTLSHFIKQYTGATVIVGGSYLTQIAQDMMPHTDIFTDYIDYLSIGNGEIALPELCKVLEANGNPEEVFHTVFYSPQKKKVINTGFAETLFDMNSLAYPDYTGFDFGDYFTPEPVFPIELSKGCYWGKCSFCDYAFGQQHYAPKTIEHIIDEFRYYVDRYGATKFIIVDECIPPAFYNRLATAIIEADLHIHFYSFARLENAFTKEVLQNIYNAGARMLLWGYECASPRVMKLMNKGIDVENRMKILRDARDVGIWNDALILFAYPTETMDEIEQTIEVCKSNTYEICSCSFTEFKMKKHSAISKKVGVNGVHKLESAGELFPLYKDTIDGPDPAERRILRRKIQFEFLDKNQHRLWPVVSADFDHVMLYVAKYGVDFVNGYRSKNRVAPEFR